ncbi:IQ calmodulin-binding protein, putative [Bodo saltans]|uniref:IQ calmodulin-binding protein, putative n=1 Tax=Bodo saltans TaxID=75058 RepID=A0A0S4IQY5_BODSA|nr:IQ calmodulin-binding protein, putative [Bodo saltans]|eukprot:CUE72567.1 IQ calmodulin-binding protein, putative [Bodo saltans]
MSVVAVARALGGRGSSPPIPNNGLVDSFMDDDSVAGAAERPDGRHCLHAFQSKHEVQFSTGPSAPTSKTITAQRDDVVRGEADANRAAKSQHEQEMRAARTIQAMIRQFLCRRQYLRYACFVKRDLQVLAERRKNIAVVVMQRIVRGFMTKRKYLKQRSQEEEKKREEAAKNKGKKKPAGGGGGGKKAATPAAPPPPIDYSSIPIPTAETWQLCRDAALERNHMFVTIVRQLLEDHFDESLATVELYLKGCSNNSPAEPIYLKVQACIQRRKNISLGLPANAVPTPAAAAAAGGAKKKK